MLPIRIIMPLILIGLFILYMLYVALIKKDLKNNLKYIYPGLFFVGIWGIFYFLILK